MVSVSRVAFTDQVGQDAVPAPPAGTVTARWGLPVCLADPVIGLDSIFLVYMLVTVRPTCSGIDVRLLEVPSQTKNNSGYTSNGHEWTFYLQRNSKH